MGSLHVGTKQRVEAGRYNPVVFRGPEVMLAGSRPTAAGLLAEHDMSVCALPNTHEDSNRAQHEADRQLCRQTTRSAKTHLVCKAGEPHTAVSRVGRGLLPWSSYEAGWRCV